MSRDNGCPECGERDPNVDELQERLDQVTRERDEARADGARAALEAENARLREALQGAWVLADSGVDPREVLQAAIADAKGAEAPKCPCGPWRSPSCANYVADGPCKPADVVVKVEAPACETPVIDMVAAVKEALAPKCTGCHENGRPVTLGPEGCRMCGRGDAPKRAAGSNRRNRNDRRR
jgi:hypothetical protein